MTIPQPFRLAQGGRIDRNKTLSFRFDGRIYEGFEGDTLASALLANGVRVVGRSFRFHRPRGIFAAGFEEPNAIMQVGDGALAEPDLKATEIRLRERLAVRAVNVWPNARFDISAVLDLFHPLLTTGFYYKTFMWPRWKWFSGAIRRAAGLGIAPHQADPADYAQSHETCDVLVIGGGPAGLCAALEAGRAGARTMLVEAETELGGALLDGAGPVDGLTAEDWVARVVAELRARDDVVLRPGCVAFGYYDHNTVGLIEAGTEPQTLRIVRARHVVLATGAFERPMVFCNNDRPNIMLAGAVRRYLHRHAVVPGRKPVIATNNDSAYVLALELQARGIAVAAVCDIRAEPPVALAEALRARRIRLLCGYMPVNARGRRALRAVTLSNGKETIELACDLLCVSGGWSPAVHLFSQSGGRLIYEPDLQAFVPDQWAQPVSAAGASIGEATLSGALRQGAIAGARAAREAGFAAGEPRLPLTEDEQTPHPAQTFWQAPGADATRAWIDLQNDVTSADVAQAARENYRSVEHLKRYTTLGMAADQGKTSNILAIGVLSEVLGKPIAQIGTTTFRPPFNPVRLGALAGGRKGAFFHPTKRLPARGAHEALRAAMDDYGGWERPAYYPRPGEDEEAAVRHEALAVRRSVGIFDASPLGKIRVVGPDAAEFLDRVYANTMKTLKPGRCRYGLMLRETGIVYDDGVLMRVSEEEFLVNTTSGHAAQIALWLDEWLQCEWRDLDVLVEDVTGQWATITLSGPRARDVLERLEPAAPIGNDALPHMVFCEGTIGGVPCRIARVSYTGERSYEVSVPADYGESLWQTSLSLGQEHGAVPVGVETVMRLRLEKGYLHVGGDTDATTYPQDVGIAGAIAKKRGDFIGRRSTMLPEAVRSDRRQFVGIEPLSPTQPLYVGSHVLRADGGSDGWVTSAGFGPTVRKFVALAMVADGRARLGEEISLLHMGRRSRARLCTPCFYDPQGVRLHG